MEEKKTWWNWLAIASFVLALVWGLLCIILIWLPLWVVCLVLALILGIAALCKKQTKRASILWIIISIFWMIIIFICSKFLLNLRNEHKDQIVTPIVEFSERVDANPEIAALMEDEKFSNIFEQTLKQKFEEKYKEEIKNIESIDWLLDIRWDIVEEMKDVATTLAEKEWIDPQVINEEPTLGIANPAAEFCVAQGWESYIVEDEDWAQMWMCRLSDGSEVDEWKYYRENANLEPEINSEETPAEATVCDEFYKSGEEITCTEQYEPVCGDNGQTYGNSCFACIEVDSYTEWECSEVAPAPAAKLMVQEWQTEEETQAMIQETCTNAWGELVDGNCVLEDWSVIAF